MKAWQATNCCRGVRPSTVRLLDPGTDLLLESADAFHEEFVEIRPGNGGKLDPLQQRHPLVQGLVQHPLVEFQPGQLAVQEQGRVIEAWRRILRPG